LYKRPKLANNVFPSEVARYHGSEVWVKGFEDELEACTTSSGLLSLSVVDNQLRTLTFDDHSPVFVAVPQSLPGFGTSLSSSNALCKEELLGHSSRDSRSLQESYGTDTLPFCELEDDYKLFLNLNREYRLVLIITDLHSIF
jgi:hypothetical protein